MKIQKLNNEKCLEILEENYYYNTYEYEGREKEIELNTHTNGGVNMLISLEANNIYNSLEEWIESFDIEEEIEVHRQDKRYCNDFTIKQSVEDFEEFKKEMEELLEQMQVKEFSLEDKKKLVAKHILEELQDYVNNCIDDFVDFETGELQKEYYNFESFILDDKEIKEILSK